MKLLITLFLSISTVLAVDVENYNYPIKNNFTATVSSSIAGFALPSIRIREKSYKIEQFEDRKKTPFFKNRHKVHFKVAYHKKKTRPLVFVLAGLGGNASGGTSNIYKQMLYQAGFHVISIGNSFNWNFNLGAISSATPGYTPKDSVDVYRYMKLAYEKAKKKLKFDVSEFHIMGYSHGGLMTTFVADLDRTEKYFNFQKVLAVNPPIIIQDSLDQLDDMRWQWDQLGFKGQKRLVDRVYWLVFKFGDKASSGEFSFADFINLANNPPFSEEEMKGGIGFLFRETLAESLAISELINKRDLFETYIGHYSPQPMLDHARTFTYKRYYEDVIGPELIEETGKTLEQLLFDSSLLAKSEYMLSNPNFRVFHNRDDVILKPGNLDLLEKIIGDKLRVYPLGGHMGNIWFERNVNDLLEFFLTPTVSRAPTSYID